MAARKIDATRARQGERLGILSKMLLASTALAGLALAVVYFVFF